MLAINASTSAGFKGSGSFPPRWKQAGMTNELKKGLQILEMNHWKHVQKNQFNCNVPLILLMVTQNLFFQATAAINCLKPLQEHAVLANRNIDHRHISMIGGRWIWLRRFRGWKITSWHQTQCSCASGEPAALQNGRRVLKLGEDFIGGILALVEHRCISKEKPKKNNFKQTIQKYNTDFKSQNRSCLLSIKRNARWHASHRSKEI